MTDDRNAEQATGEIRLLIQRLAEAAQHADRSLLRLETGDCQWAAIRFYQRYRFCAPVEPYSTMPPENIATSIFTENKLL